MKELSGWIEGPKTVLPQQQFSESWDYERNNTFLYNTVKKVLGKYWDYKQKIADCCSFTWAKYIDYLQCMQIEAGEKILFNPTVSEAIHGLGRVEIGKQHGQYNDGCMNVWCAQALREFGALGRNQYGPYDPNRARLWGAKGLPDELEPYCHKITIWSEIKNFDQAAKAIAGAHLPVTVGSKYEFKQKRDKEGFSEGTLRNDYGHSMLFMGVIFGARPGLYCDNHFGDIEGPTPYDMPKNGFFIDADICDKMLVNDSQIASK